MNSAVRGITARGTALLKDGRPFQLQGVSFFNAIFNPAFNQGPQSRRQWLDKFCEYGINAPRVWCQWDFTGPHSQFVDISPAHTLFAADGALRTEHLDRLALGSMKLPESHGRW